MTIQLSVQSWDPAARELTSAHREILQKASERMRSAGLQLSEEEQALLRPVMQLGADLWLSFISPEATDDIVAWIRLLTLIERDLSGFEAGDKSPVLPMLRELKKRNAVPTDLFAWIRANTRNRFLPYGSLGDRL